MVRRILLSLLFFVVQIARSAQSALDVFIRDSFDRYKYGFRTRWGYTNAGFCITGLALNP